MDKLSAQLKEHWPIALAIAAVVIYLLFFRSQNQPQQYAAAATGPNPADVLQAETALGAQQAQTAQADIAAKAGVVSKFLDTELAAQQSANEVTIAKANVTAAQAIATTQANAQVEAARLQAQAEQQKNSQGFIGGLVNTFLPFLTGGSAATVALVLA